MDDFKKYLEHIQESLKEDSKKQLVFAVKNKNGGKLGEVTYLTGVPVFNFDKKYASQYNYGISDIESILYTLKSLSNKKH